MEFAPESSPFSGATRTQPTRGSMGSRRSSLFIPVKAVKALVASTLPYATSSSFLGTAIVARSDCSWRRIVAVIGIPRQCFDAAIRLA